MSELIQFEGRTVAIIAPEDLETLERERAALEARLAAADAWRTRAEAVLRQVASECAECGGTGVVHVGGRPTGQHCPDCADIRALLDPRTPGGDDEGSLKLMANAADAAEDLLR